MYGQSETGDGMRTTVPYCLLLSLFRPFEEHFFSSMSIYPKIGPSRPPGQTMTT